MGEKYKDNKRRERLEIRDKKRAASHQRLYTTMTENERRAFMESNSGYKRPASVPVIPSELSSRRLTAINALRAYEEALQACMSINRGKLSKHAWESLRREQSLINSSKGILELLRAEYIIAHDIKGNRE